VSEGHFNQGEAYYRAGEWSKARTEVQASYEISRLELAQTYIKEGDSVRAIAALKAYLKTPPSDADAQAKLASLEAALPQSAQAPPSQTQALPIPTRAPSANQTPRQTRKLLFLPLAGAGLVLLGVTASAARDIESQPRTQLDPDAALARRDKLELGAILSVASGFWRCGAWWDGNCVQVLAEALAIGSCNQIKDKLKKKPVLCCAP